MRYNRNMDLARFNDMLQKECHLSGERLIVVGVSGGPDSLCLLHVLHQMGYPQLAVHVNHQLRDEADADENFVKEFAASMQVPCLSVHVDVRSYSRREKLSIEESARHLRYQCLFEQARKNDAQAIAVAHQADDQVETVMMHILRGSGPTGVKGMAYRSYFPIYSDSIPVVRPLLGVWREEIDHYCDENGIHPCTDQTNSDPRYFRNRIRLELMPDLGTYNPRAKEHLWQLAALAREEDALLEQQTDQALQKIIKNPGIGFTAFSIREFNGLPLAIRRRAVRGMIGSLRADLRDIGFEVIEKTIKFVEEAGSNGEWQLLDDLWITRLDDDSAMIFKGDADFSELWPLLGESEMLPCALEGDTRINDHWAIHAEIIAMKDPLMINQRDEETCFDLAFLKSPLHFRAAKVGERIKPFGGAKISQKLSDLFINKKVHRKARPRWPILCCGEEALWVVGVKRTQYAPVTAHTERVLVLRLIRLD